MWQETIQVAEKKPRLRKTAPTIRERVESAQLDAEKQNKKNMSSTKEGKRTLKKFPTSKFRVPGRLVSISRLLVPRYFIDSWREVRQVTWPTRRETWRLTGAVFVFAVIFGAMVAAVDKGLGAIFRNFILK